MSLKAPARRFIVSSPPIWRLHGAAFEELTSEEPILIPDGERHKQLATVGRIYDALIRAGADRATTIIAVGGGVVGDVAGFAAATYLRGVPVVHVPTTLLAQVDSAIGGKVGVNHPLGKNLIGAFHQPLAVVVDPELLATLPRREFRAGLYEVVKYGVIASRPLFDRLSPDLPSIFKREPALLAAIIAESCQIKATVVSADEREAGPAARAELRPHDRARARGGHEVPALPARRSGRVRDARGRRARRRRGASPDDGSRRPAWRSSPGWGRCRRSPTYPPRRCVEASAATRRSSADGCTSSCPRQSVPPRRSPTSRTSSCSRATAAIGLRA